MPYRQAVNSFPIFFVKFSQGLASPPPAARLEGEKAVSAARISRSAERPAGPCVDICQGCVAAVLSDAGQDADLRWKPTQGRDTEMKARIALITPLIAAVLLGLGCKTTIVGTGGESQATYRLGTLKSQEARGIDVLYQAAEQAMTTLGLNVIQKNKDALQGEIVARDAQDKKITVKLASITKDSTKLTIDAGSIEKDRRIYQAIKSTLPGGM